MKIEKMKAEKIATLLIYKIKDHNKIFWEIWVKYNNRKIGEDWLWLIKIKDEFGKKLFQFEMKGQYEEAPHLVYICKYLSQIVIGFSITAAASWEHLEEVRVGKIKKIKK